MNMKPPSRKVVLLNSVLTRMETLTLYFTFEHMIYMNMYNFL